MTGLADPKQGKRIVDLLAVRRALLTYPNCAACSGPASNAHHIVQKGSPHFGDDVIENIVGLCGTGTMRCHGAIHGSPYTVYPTAHGYEYAERRDADWVAERIGNHLLRRRPDVIVYVTRKLGLDAGAAYLERFYKIHRV